MKKMLQLLAILGLFLPLFLSTGCEKDTNDGPVAYAPEITANYIIGEPTRGVAQPVTLNWDSKNADSCFLNGELLPSLKGSKEVSVTDEVTSFVFKAKNTVGSKIVEVKVKKLAKPEVYISASITDLPKGGGKTKLTVNVKNANNLTSIGGEYNIFPVVITTGWIDHDSTFVFTANGDGGETTSSITITVVPPSEQELTLKGDAWTVSRLEGSYYTTDGPWTDFYDYIGDKITFYISQPYPYKLKANKACANGTCEDWYDWVLNGSFLTGFGDRTIESLSEHEMVLILKSYSNNGNFPVPWFVRETYTR